MSEYQKKILGRKRLKTLFKKGRLPSEEDFEILVDSTFNKYDDNLDVTEENGLQVHAVNRGELISFFDTSEESASWQLKFSESFDGIIFEKQGKHTKHPLESGISREGTTKTAQFFIANGGDVGIGTAVPEHRLDVRGNIASKGRVGTYAAGEVAADGKWHNVFENDSLPDFSAFEIMAAARGRTEREIKYALTHATVVGVRGDAKCKITQTKAYQGKRWNKIDFRWETRNKRLDGYKAKNIVDRLTMLFEPKNPLRYNLQIRTHSNYGENAIVRFRVTQLWNEDVDITQPFPTQNKEDQ